MMKSLFGVHNDISILEHRNWYTVTKAFERSQIEPDRYRTYWPSNVPKLSKEDIERADRAWIENNIRDPGLRAFVRSVTENTCMWQAYRSHVIVEDDDDQERDLLLSNVERLVELLRRWEVCVFGYFVDRGDTSIV